MVPENPKIYHIVHVDKIGSIMRDQHIYCDAQMRSAVKPGTNIGMNHIKDRRLHKQVSSHKNLRVGDCVPFYFCPRSIMLYLIHRSNSSELEYKGGQESIVHLEADLKRTVEWARDNNRKWLFTLSNAGSSYFEERCDLNQLSDLDWATIQAREWRHHREGKQAEFLIEASFPWHLVETIGVFSQNLYNQTMQIVNGQRPSIQIKPDWYY